MFHVISVFFYQYNINFITISLSNFMIYIKVIPFFSLPIFGYAWAFIKKTKFN